MDFGPMILKAFWQAFLTLAGMWQMWALLIVVFVVPLIPKLYEQWRFSRAGMDEIDQMGGIEFERYLESVFRRLGYRVERTRAIGDQGGDLVLAGNGERIIVQAKRWSKAVGNKAVQEVYAAQAHYGCDRAIVVANQEFTKSARELAASTQVELWGRHKLAEIILSLDAAPGEQSNDPAPTPMVTEQSAAQESAVPVCERCGRPMVKRNGRRGPFWGCSGYPQCHFTREL